MKIGVVSQWFPPEPIGLLWTLCTGLAERGHAVRALTGFPNYPAGELYPGYRQRWHHRERIGPVDVRRVPLYASHDDHPVRRAANYLSFAATSTAAGRFLAGADVAYVYATPVTAAAAAVAARKLFKIPYVLHVQDLWPDSVTESEMIRNATTARIGARVIDSALRRLYAGAGHVIAIAPTMAATLQRRGVAARRVSVVYNWAADEAVAPVAPDPALRARLGRSGRTIAVFAGNLGTVQDLETVIGAAALSDADGTPVDVAIIGSGARRDALDRLVKDTAASNVRLLDPVPRTDMPAIYASADYQLVTLKDRPVFRGTIPSKLPSALAQGSPVITTVAGDVAAMCADGGFGFAAEPERPAALARVFHLAGAASADERRRMARAAREYYRSRMSQRASLDAIEAILARTASAGRT